MGNYMSLKNGNQIDEEIKDLEKTIDKQAGIILKQTQMIKLLKTKKNDDYYLTGGFVMNKDKDNDNKHKKDHQCNNCEKHKEDKLDKSNPCEMEKLLQSTKSEKKYEYLVFSGGGIKGTTFLGALSVLEKQGILYDKDGNSKIKGYAGTSAGSIIAALLAVGYTRKELKKIMLNLDTVAMVDDKCGVIRDTINFAKDYGLAPGNYIVKFLGDLIKKKTGNSNYTLDDLYRDKKIKLVIVGTDVNRERSIYFYHNHLDKNYRNVPIKTAVRISMSIPFVFEPVLFNEGYCVDGGMLDNYPIHVFDGEYPGDMRAQMNLCPPNPNVLGMNILTTSEIDNYLLNKRKDINGLWEYAMSFLGTFLTDNEIKIMTPSYWLRTINIRTKDYPLTDFSLTEEQKLVLIGNGKTSATEFFEQL